MRRAALTVFCSTSGATYSGVPHDVCISFFPARTAPLVRESRVRGQIRRRARTVAIGGKLVDDLGEAKVRNFDGRRIARVGEQQVLGLQVAMRDAATV